MFRDVAAKMVPNGWRNIIPLTIETGQKKPAVKWAEYQHEDIPLDTLRSWFRGRLGQMPLTGMVFGPSRSIVALDIDVTDPALNDRINNALESEGSNRARDPRKIAQQAVCRCFGRDDAREPSHRLCEALL